jgi:hypothetical protein
MPRGSAYEAAKAAGGQSTPASRRLWQTSTVTPSTLMVEKHAVPAKGAQSPDDNPQPGKHMSPPVAVPTHALCSPRKLLPEDPSPTQSDETAQDLVHHCPLHVRPV